MSFLYPLFRRSLETLLGLPPVTSVCRFTPSCSIYYSQARTRFGFLKGNWLCFKRLLRCHPLSPAGPDPLPSA